MGSESSKSDSNSSKSDSDSSSNSANNNGELETMDCLKMKILLSIEFGLLKNLLLYKIGM